MRLLVCLAERAGEIVSIDELLDRVWSGVTVAPDSVYQAVASLRRLLGDDPKQPTYIATVPRLGYQLVAPVEPWDDSTARLESPPSRSRYPIYLLASLAVAGCGQAGQPASGPGAPSAGPAAAPAATAPAADGRKIAVTANVQM